MWWRQTCRVREWKRMRSWLLWRNLQHRLLASSTNHAGMGRFRSYMEVSREVADAVATGHPVVALETTLVTHGMPHPENVNTAIEVEEIIRSHNVVPATIGILDGRIHVGMSTAQLHQLAEAARLGKVAKVSRRDLAYTLSQGMSGGTTVAATVMCAERAGVQIFVTGGLGGVHRGGEKTMDVSADITELGHTQVAVVCAGVKSLLDIGRTLEVLETEGVAVATYGDPNSDFPAFFTRCSGFKAPFNVESPAAAAKLIDSSLRFDVGSGVVIAVPIPDHCSAEGSEIETAIQEALHSAVSEGVEGKEMTPFILRRVNELTGGKSLLANISLVKNNAHVGSRIASELARLRADDKPSDNQPKPVMNSGVSAVEKNSSSAQKTPVVIGASIFDFIAKVASPEIKSEGTNPGTLHQSFGGVARNVAECMCRCGTNPFFISAVGDDMHGWSLGRGLRDLGMCLSGVYSSPTARTASYCVLLNSQGELTCGVGDMDIHSCITPEWVAKFEPRLREAPMVCVDGNMPAATVQYICNVCHDGHVPVWFEPTGADKATMVVHEGVLEKIRYMSPNLAELRSIHGALYGTGTSKTRIAGLSLEQKLRECSVLVPPLLDYVPHVLTSLGRDGVVWGRRQGEEGDGERNTLSHFSTLGHPTHNHHPISVSGAGDSFVGCMMSCLVQGFSHDLAIKAGLRAANLSVLSMQSISPDLEPNLSSEHAIQDWAPWKPREIECASQNVHRRISGPIALQQSMYIHVCVHE